LGRTDDPEMKWCVVRKGLFVDLTMPAWIFWSGVLLGSGYQNAKVTDISKNSMKIWSNRPASKKL
jgi:hypothetical protein